jgi:hypothetical protein
VRAAYAGTAVSVVGEGMSEAVRLSYQSASERFPASWLSCDLCFERDAFLVERSQADPVGHGDWKIAMMRKSDREKNKVDVFQWFRFVEARAEVFQKTIRSFDREILIQPR